MSILHISIYFGCLFVCLYQINVKTLVKIIMFKNVKGQPIKTTYSGKAGPNFKVNCDFYKCII